ncbi:hypothetical protein [Microbulbifer sp. DLAB2-AA]|uniref:hypothetical protein n=1 Tax=Microbulbifer sp. DLAB2-AA TaxID=3243394 RepID=UPI004039A241
MSTLQGILFSLVIFILGLFVYRFLTPYLTQKGKNLATKEDTKEIKTIQERVGLEHSQKLEEFKYTHTRELEKLKQEHTKELEEIKNQNSLLLEKFKNHNSLRLAAADKRLEIHAEACRHLYEIVIDLEDKTSKNHDLAVDLSTFIWSNIIYFDGKIHSQLIDTSLILVNAFHHRLKLQMKKISIKQYEELLKQAKVSIGESYSSILVSVELPPMKIIDPSKNIVKAEPA